MSSNFVGSERLDGSSREVFEIPGEPAVVINGVPVVCAAATNDGGGASDRKAEEESEGDKGFGEWLEGREVRKLFGETYYSGAVTGYDREAGWYRVVYADGDSEDLDWHELRAVIQPLDIMVPLKTLALKTVKRTKKASQNRPRIA